MHVSFSSDHIKFDICIFKALVANAYAIREPHIPKSDAFKEGGVPDDQKLRVAVAVSSSPDTDKSTKAQKRMIDYLFTWEQEKESRKERDTRRSENVLRAINGMCRTE